MNREILPINNLQVLNSERAILSSVMKFPCRGHPAPDLGAIAMSQCLRSSHPISLNRSPKVTYFGDNMLL